MGTKLSNYGGEKEGLREDPLIIGVGGSMPNRIVHFEIPVDDAGRAIKFYEEVFGWKISKWEGPMPYWLVMTGDEEEPGIDGGISMRKDLPTTTNMIDILDIDEFMEKIKSGGGSIVSEKMTIPGVGYMAYCMDTEGNRFGIMQSDERAK
jgi:predicted enzyme related to lactoylglutathione lyase